MFSGKTTRLIRIIKKEAYAKKNVAIFKPTFYRTRNGEDLVSRNGARFPASLVQITPSGIRIMNDIVVKRKLDVVGVDEIHFFPPEIVSVLHEIAYTKRVIACGLDLDFKGDSFETTAELMMIADHITRLIAVCAVCGQRATLTQRLIGGKPASRSSPVILIGGKVIYEPRCTTHHKV